MSNTQGWVRRAAIMGLGAVLLGGFGASQGATLGSQLAAMSGTDLTRAECQERMQKLDTLLQSAGYRSMRTRMTEDGTLVARWYNTATNMTALAFSGQLTAGNAFSAREYSGMIRWNEFIALR